MANSITHGDYVNLLPSIAALSISSAVSSSATTSASSSTLCSTALSSSTTVSSSTASQAPSVTKGPRAKRCLFPPMEEVKPYSYPTVSTWMNLGRRWSFNISQEQAVKINNAILLAIGHMNTAQTKNIWLPFEENLIISPDEVVYWRIAPLTGANKETQWKIIEVCSKRGFPPVSLQVLHLAPSNKELQLCKHFSQNSMSSHGLLSLENIGNALVSRYMEDGCLEDSIGSIPMSLLRKISFAYQIAQGLHYLHQCGVAHRDISTRNIIIHGTQANICDFGSACFIDEKNPEEPVPIRTSATEILLQLDPKDLALADLYSLGIVYHCLFSSTKYENLFRSDAFCHGLTPHRENFSMFCHKRSQIETWPGRDSLPTDIKPVITKLLKESPLERIVLDQILEILKSRNDQADKKD